MRVQDQRETKAFLSDPASHGTPGPVDVIETHISAVFLAGGRAFKLKQAVHLPYADFSTPEIRLAACEKEVALNRVVAPGLYRGVRRITRDAGGGLAFDGPGVLVDAVVEMERFAQEDLFDRLAERGALTGALVCQLADGIAAAHRAAPPVPGEDGVANIAWVLDINRAGFHEGRAFSEAEIEAIDGAFRAGLDRHGALLRARAGRGCIRRCHGDLHLRNVCLFRGRPTLFDCIDFNDRLATVDVLYDLAFMAMDLWHRGHRELANLLVNRYLDRGAEEDGFVLMPFFMALRAAVRAHVTATQADTAPPAEAGRLRAAARGYYGHALAMLEPRPARLVVLGGLSGSGKSTVAAALAPEFGPPPGARVLESDRLRKAMFEVAPETRLPPQAYAPEVSGRVYAALAERAGALLGQGGCVIAGAVFDRPEGRLAIEAAAKAAGVRVDGFWLEAAPETLLRRVAERVPGASDATVEVVRAQLARPPVGVDWPCLGTSGPLEDTLQALRARLAAPGGG